MYVGTPFLFMIVLYSILRREFKSKFSDPNVADRDSLSKRIIIPVFKNFYNFKNFYLTLRRVTTYNGAGPTCEKFKVYHLLALRATYEKMYITTHWRTRPTKVKNSRFTTGATRSRPRCYKISSRLLLNK